MNCKNSVPEHRLRLFPDMDSLAGTLAEEFLAAVARSERNALPFFVALSGGNTPRKFFKQLTEKAKDISLKWAHCHFFWCDERCVPPNHPDSNFGAFYEMVARPLQVPEANLHRIQGEADPKAECLRLERELSEMFQQAKNGKQEIDWLFLGLGEDGHTASLFPNSPLLNLSDRWFGVAQHPATGQMRITMTPACILLGKRISFVVTGASKAEMVSKVLKAKKCLPEVPATYIRPNSGGLEWYLDSPAASRITDQN